MARGPIVRDLGWRRIRAEVSALAGKRVEVGLQDDGTAQDGTLVAEYGAYNEYGTRRIPERSFMRSAFDENAGNLAQLMARLGNGVAAGAIGAHQAAELLGQTHQKQIQAKIGKVGPPNAASTIRRKKSSTPLIDTGLMRQSIRYVVKG